MKVQILTMESPSDSILVVASCAGLVCWFFLIMDNHSGLRDVAIDCHVRDLHICMFTALDHEVRQQAGNETTFV